MLQLIEDLRRHLGPQRRLVFARHHLGVPTHHGERRAEVVQHAAEHLPDGGQAGTAFDLILRLPALKGAADLRGEQHRQPLVFLAEATFLVQQFECAKGPVA